MSDEFYPRKNSLRLRGFDYSNHRAYFVTVVAHERKPAFLNKQLSRDVIKCLIDLRFQFDFNLYVYCLMPDHLHAMIGTGNSNRSLGEICGAFKSKSNRLYWKYGKGKLWQRQFYDHVIRNEEDFFESMAYIRLNPVRKKLVERIEDWEFTGIVDRLYPDIR